MPQIKDNQKLDTIVTLTVDTQGINESNKNTKVSFSDNRQDPAETPGDPTNYISTVSSTKDVTFRAVVLNQTTYPDDSAGITKVFKKDTGGGKSILKKDSYDGDNGIVEAKVRNDKVDGTEQYTVTIQVVACNYSSNAIGCEDPVDYSLDPKLQMNA